MKIIDYLEEILIVVFLLVMTVITFSNVVSRYVLHASWSFTEEITTNFFVWASFLGAAVAVKRKGHLGLSYLTDFLPPRLQKAAALFAVVVSVTIFVILLKYGIDMVISQYKMGQTTPALGLPEWTFGISVPIGAVFLLIRFVELGYRELKGGDN
ncbi:MAG: TRAP transporter small permease [Peptococcaceae bacterium]|jgi:C4-dicarboxylate transporter DctQ subunit|nr:TRAP transporter small permease [Peptococcaceae bacterium]MDH7524988.1 TRAP transporter small permease [Peptococcaceae bacterium]